MYAWGVCVALWLLDAHLGNSIGCRTVTIMAPLLLTSGLAVYEDVLHSCGRRPVGWRVWTCDSAHSWWLYSAASREHQAVGTMTCYPIQSHYPDNEPTSPCPILIMLSDTLGSEKYQFFSHWFDSTRVRKLQGPDSNRRCSDSLIFQNGWWTLYSFGHPNWLCGFDRYCSAVVKDSCKSSPR